MEYIERILVAAYLELRMLGTSETLGESCEERGCFFATNNRFMIYQFTDIFSSVMVSLHEIPRLGALTDD